MNRLIFLVCLLLFSVTCFASVTEKSAALHPYRPRVLKIQSEEEVDSLAEAGVNILRRRGNIILCLFPEKEKTIPRAMRPRRIAPTLDKAKEYYNAWSIQNGEAIEVSLTGRGVVVGICDLGLDPLHPTFLDEEGRSRIKRIVQYKEREGDIIRIEGDEAYREWQTDSVDEFHATHVCGILAGGGAGTRYSGIASDAEIVATLSSLTEVGLLAGVEDIIDYAKETGQPAVINISVGSFTGAHDGTSLFSQYLDLCSDDAIIVLSAGNEGHRTNYLTADFHEGRKSVTFRLGDKTWLQKQMYGATDIWSGTDSPFKISLSVYDDQEKTSGEEFASFTLNGGEDPFWYWSSDSDDNIALPFKGYIYAEGEVDRENGRHHTTLAYNFESEEQTAGKDWARYVLEVKVSGSPGEDVEVYSDGSFTRLIGVAGNPIPSTERTVSDLACGHRVICVGMYGNRNYVPVNAPEGLETSAMPTGYEEGGTVRYSSYGTLRDGRVMPLTIAPGATLMSALSRSYLMKYPNTEHFDFGKELGSGQEEGSIWISEGGTSMASPYVAGYIATWLECVPDLTAEDVIEIIGSTNRTDISEPDDPHNGRGYFDPVAGLRMALAKGGVETVRDPGAILQPDDIVEVYDLMGRKIYSGSVSGLSGISKGIYLVQTPFGVMKTGF